MTDALAKLSKAEQWLAEAKTPEEFGQIHALANAAEAYARASKLGASAINHALEIKALSGAELGKLDTQPQGKHIESSSPNLDVMRQFRPQERADFKVLAKLPDRAVRAIVHKATEEARKLSWYSIVLGARGKNQQDDAVERAKTVTPLPKTLISGPFQSANIAPNSVDLIFTDPPYDVGAIDLYADLSALAANVLRPGGICMAYAGQFTLPDAIINLGQNLEYAWIAGIKHTGGQLRFRKYHIHNAWKPILVFYKPPLECWWDWFSDMIDGGGREKDDHEWQQAEAEAAHYIAALSPVGGSVLDPMCGSGTSLVAAKKLGRTYLGIDVDVEALHSAARRLNE